MKGIDGHTLKKAAAGDMEAFEQIVAQYEKLIYNIAYHMFSNSEDASDMLQEVFIKVYKNIGGFYDYKCFKSWICKIATNTCIDELRKRKGKEAESLDQEAENGRSVKLQIISHAPTPEEVAVNNESWQNLRKAINKLSDDDKTLIILRDLQGLSYDELASATETNLGTVKSRLSRARNKLKCIFLKEQNEDALVIK